MALNLGSVIMKLDGDPSGLISAANRANLSLAGVNKMASNVAKQGLGALNNGFRATAGIIQASFVGAMGAGAGATIFAVTETNKFNASMANVASLMPGATARVNELKAGVQDLAIKMGVSTDDISGGLYQVVSAFGDTADSMKILEINAKSAKAGLATTTDAINLTSAVTKAYGDTSAEAVQKASDLALMTVRLGQTTFPELASSVGRVTPLMKQLGGSQEELFAVMATMTGVTGGAAEVSTQLAGALQSVMAPTKDTSELMKKLGFANGQAMIKGLGVQGSIKALVGEANRSGKPLQNFIGSIEGQVLSLGLAGPQAEDYKNKLAQMGLAAGATDAAFAEQTTGVNALGFKFAQIKTQAVVLAQKFGDKLAPGIIKVADAISDNLAKINVDEIVNSFTNLYNLIFNGDFSGEIFGLGEDDPIIDTLFDIREGFLEIYNSITSNTPLMESLLVGLGAVVGTLVVGAFASMAVAVFMAIWPFILLGGIVAGLYYLWTTNFGGMRDGLVAFWTLVQPILMGLWSMFMTQLMPSIVQMGQALMGMWNIISPFLIPVFQFLAVVLGVIIVGAIIGAMVFIRLIAMSITNFANTVGTAVGGVKNYFMSMLNTAIFIKDGIISAFQGIQNGIGNALKGVVNALIRNINNAVGGVNNVIRNLPEIPGIGKVPQIPRIPGFKKGVTNFEGGLAYVHQDEMLTNLPKGTDVIKASDTRKMLDNNSKPNASEPKQTIINIIFPNKPIFMNFEDAKDMAKKVKQAFKQEGFKIQD